MTSRFQKIIMKLPQEFLMDKKLLKFQIDIVSFGYT